MCPKKNIYDLGLVAAVIVNNFVVCTYNVHARSPLRPPPGCYVLCNCYCGCRLCCRSTLDASNGAVSEAKKERVRIVVVKSHRLLYLVQRRL